MAIDRLLFQRSEEALARRIIPTVAPTAYALLSRVAAALLPDSRGCILTPLIGVQHIVIDQLILQCHDDCLAKVTH